MGGKNFYFFWLVGESNRHISFLESKKLHFSHKALSIRKLLFLTSHQTR